MIRALALLVASLALATAATAQGTCPAQPEQLALPNNRVQACATQAETRRIEVETTSALGTRLYQTPIRSVDWTIGLPETIDLGGNACGLGTIKARSCNLVGECGAWGVTSTATFRACPVPGPPTLSEP